MRATLKVAELASFIYAFLFFGSFCINAAYYTSFGIDITAYMSMSEILLLFLGQPLLYVPILCCIIISIMTPTEWPQVQKSYKFKYTAIALTNDKLLMSLTFFSFVLLYFWYDVNYILVLTYLLTSFFIWLILPSTANAEFRYFICTIKSIPKGFSLIWQVIKRKKRVHLKQKYGRKITKKERKKDNGQLFIRKCILESKLLRADKDFINLVYPNKTIYCLAAAYVFSILTMSSVNLLRSDSLKRGFIKPEKVISLTYLSPLDNLPIKDSLDSLLYIGESNKYIFFYSKESNESVVISRNNIPIHGIKKTEGQSLFEKTTGVNSWGIPSELLDELEKKESVRDTTTQHPEGNSK